MYARLVDYINIEYNIHIHDINIDQRQLNNIKE